MGKFCDTYYNRVANLFKKAITLDKPIRDDVTWTFGIMNGRTDFDDLQCHALVQAVSIIINEPVVPKILCVWDAKSSPFVLRAMVGERNYQYPRKILSMFPEWKGDNVYLRTDEYHYENKYFTLHRAPLSVNSYPNYLGLGYRAKYSGLPMITTKYGIMSDADLICIKPGVQTIMDNVAKDPEKFCWSAYEDATAINVGLLAFDIDKYNRYYMPTLMRNYWKLTHRDSEFLKTLHTLEPDMKEKLSVGSIGDKSIIGHVFYHCARRDDMMTEHTAYYHAWKGEERRGNNLFYDFYESQLAELEKRVHQ